MRTTEHPHNGRRDLPWTARLVSVVTLGVICVALLAMAGCSSGSQGASSGASSSDAQSLADAHMAGPPVDVHISSAAIAAKPQPMDLSTPASAVRSYLNWSAYAYRIGQSEVATGAMSPDEGVRVDSYIQYNLEQKRLIDEKLTSLSLGAPSVGSTSTLVPAKEQWTYRYVSIDQGNATVAGPYTASYNSTYTVVKSKNGNWVVYSVAAKPLGTVK